MAHFEVNFSYVCPTIGDKSLVKSCAPKINSTKKACDEFLFHDTGMSDKEVGGILLAIALIILCVCLACIVKLLHSMLKGQIAKVRFYYDGG
jgi:sodium-dependent phosphate cotransporter